MFNLPKRIFEKYIFNNGAAFNILPDVNNSKLDGTAVPEIGNVTHFLAGASAPVTITNFLRGADFQTISILGDGFTTVSHNTNIKTNTGADKLLAANLIYRFTHINAVWYEDA